MDGWIWTGVPAGQLRDEGCVGSLGFAAVSHVLSTPPRARLPSSLRSHARTMCVVCVPVPVFGSSLGTSTCLDKALEYSPDNRC